MPPILRLVRTHEHIHFCARTCLKKRSLPGHFCGLKSSKKANYDPKSGVFQGFLFTTKLIERSSEIFDKLLIQSALLIALCPEKTSKSGYDRGEGVGLWALWYGLETVLAWYLEPVWHRFSLLKMHKRWYSGDRLFSAKRVDTFSTKRGAKDAPNSSGDGFHVQSSTT